MADARALGARGVTRGGSSPLSGIQTKEGEAYASLDYCFVCIGTFLGCNHFISVAEYWWFPLTLFREGVPEGGGSGVLHWFHTPLS